MNEQSPHPFVVRHPMSLRDVVAALFRGNSKGKPLSANPAADQAREVLLPGFDPALPLGSKLWEPRSRRSDTSN